LPEKYVLDLLTKDFLDLNNKKIILSKDFDQKCANYVEEYQEKLDSAEEITIREVQQKVLEFLSQENSSATDFERASSPDFTPTKATAEIEKCVSNCLKIRNMKVAGTLPSCGTPGLLLEGMPGIGKSVLIEAYLMKEVPNDYVKIDASTSLAEKKLQIINAFEQGKILFIDELDTFIEDDIEKMLNLALSGDHPDETKQGSVKGKAGFALFATSNGIAFEGRKLIGPALRHRITCPSSELIEPHDVDDVIGILASWTGDSAPDMNHNDFKAIAETYVALANENKNIRGLKSFCEKEGIFTIADNGPAIFPTQFRTLSNVKSASKEL
jgi:hypothetical protein